MTETQKILRGLGRSGPRIRRVKQAPFPIRQQRDKEIEEAVAAAIDGIMRLIENAMKGAA